ncbi:hypothetical protein [Streptomyces beijiangensis]|uniref:Integral membrane protein n=1 Tax=Streptomyces beijiangensis TaxID=163361 RepID=A0A939FCP3_9ACTN|nr:hypothetical protein [Streptomyces beijiangensis]MBO0515603.1 hypothetical protein [Streptomyces beijiangensis]
MYGPAPSIDNGNSGVRILVRVLLTACALLTIGILSCVPLFRIAALRRRWWDWVLASVGLVLGIGCFAAVGELPEESGWSDAALAVLLLLGVGSATYFLIVDIQHPHRPRPQAAPAPHFSQKSTLGQYGPYQPYAQTVPTQVPVVPVPPPQHQQPVPPPRIDQVRAELDELSDLLRKKPDDRPGQGR